MRLSLGLSRLTGRIELRLCQQIRLPLLLRPGEERHRLIQSPRSYLPPPLVAMTISANVLVISAKKTVFYRKTGVQNT